MNSLDFKQKVREFIKAGNQFTISSMARYLGCSNASIRYHLQRLDLSAELIDSQGEKALDPIKSINISPVE